MSIHAFSAPYRMVRREWRPCHHGDSPRGVGMLKPNVLVVGSSHGMVYLVREEEIVAAFPLVSPRVAIQTIQVIKTTLMIDGRDRQDGHQMISVFDMGPTQSSLEETLILPPSLIGIYSWTNMTMFHTVMDHVYLRISSDHWMFGHDGNNKTSIPLGFSPDARIMTACAYSKFVFLLMDDWTLHILLMDRLRIAERANVSIPHLAHDLPSSLSVSPTSTPSLCQVAIGSNRLCLFELGLVFSGKNNISEWTEIPMPRRLLKICFLNPDMLVLMDSRYRFELFQWKLRSSLVMTMFSHPYHTRIHPMYPFLALDGDNEILYWESVKIKHPRHKRE